GVNRTSGKVSTKKKADKITKDKTVTNAQKQSKSVKVKRKSKAYIKPSYTTVKPILPKGQNTSEIPMFLTTTAPLAITSCVNGSAPVASILRQVIVASNITPSINTKQTILQKVDAREISKRQVLSLEKSDIIKSKCSKSFTNKCIKPIINKPSKRNVAIKSNSYTVSFKESKRNERNSIRDPSSKQNSNVESHLENNIIIESSPPKTLYLETESNQNLHHEIPHWPPPPPYPEQLNRRNIQNKVINRATSSISTSESQFYAISTYNKLKQDRNQSSTDVIEPSKEMALDMPVAKMLAESSQSGLSYTSSFCESVNVSSSYATSTPLLYSSPPHSTHTPPPYTRLSSSPLGVVATYSSPSPLPLSSYSNSSPLSIEPSTVPQTYSPSITSNPLTSCSENNRSTQIVNGVEQSPVNPYSASTYSSSLPYSDASFYQDPIIDNNNKTGVSSPDYLTTYNPPHSSSYSDSIQLPYTPLDSISPNSHYVDESTNYSYSENYQGSYKEISTNSITFSSQEIDKSSYFPSVRSPSPPSYHAHFQNSCYNTNITSQQNNLPSDNHSPLPSFRKCTTDYSITCNSSHEINQDQLLPYPSSPGVTSCSTQPHLPLPPPQPPPPQYSSTPRNTSEILYENYYFSETFGNAENCTTMSQDNDGFSESQNSFHNIISEPSSFHHHSVSSLPLGYPPTSVSANNTNIIENKFYDYEHFSTNMTDYYNNSLASTPAQDHLNNGNQIEPFFDSNKISSLEASHQHRKYKSFGRESPDSECIGDDSASINESLKVLLYVPEQEQNKIYQERKEKAWSLLNQAELETKRDATLKEKFWIEEDEPLADGIINGDRIVMQATDTEKAKSDTSNSTSSFINSFLKKKTSKYLLCQVCGKMLKGTNSLKSHLASHQSFRPHRCPYCSKRFTCKSTLKNHQRIHTGEMPFTCNICSMTFRTKSSLERHKVLHSDLRPFQCSVCHKSFKTKLVLQNHVKIHIVGLFLCSICGKTFPRQKSLLIHKASHSATSRKFQCPHCSKAYQFRSLLNNHLQLHLNIQKHWCHVCNQAFVWRSSLTAHLRTHSKKRWNCDTCSRSFASEKAFESHNCHHGTRKK
ncbi:unnamed protein product, partial [Meganyctiphanes norvegica]